MMAKEGRAKQAKPNEIWQANEHADHEATVNSREQMTAAFCSQVLSDHAEHVVCIERRLKTLDPKKTLDPATPAKAELRTKLRAFSPGERRDAYEEVLEFWCNDPLMDRDGDGLCLSWKLRRDRMLVPTPTPSGAKNDAVRTKEASGSLYRKEMDDMHEWYCTSTDREVEDDELCLSWKLRIKTYSIEERKRLDQIRKAKKDTKHDAFKRAQQAMSEALESKDAAAIEKAHVALKETKVQQRAAFNAMRTAWCSAERTGYDEKSQVCVAHAREMLKAEL